MIKSRSTITPCPASSFVREHRRYDRMLAGFERHLLDRCVDERGLHVIDVGCGAGTTSLGAAQRVGAEGLVLGIDTDADAIDVAAQRGRLALMTQLMFRRADAETVQFLPGNFDRVISRFGVLHFSDPIAAFANLRTALAPSGRLGFVCPRSPRHNPWATRPLSVVRAILGGVPEPRLGAGPFAFAEPSRIHAVLGRAGFGDVSLEALDEPVVLGADVEDVIEFFFETDLRQVEASLDARNVHAIADGLREVLADWVDGDTVSAPAGAWLVTAKP